MNTFQTLARFTIPHSNGSGSSACSDRETGAPPRTRTPVSFVSLLLHVSSEALNPSGRLRRLIG